MTCPGCGEDSSSRLPIFSEEGTASGERGSVVRGLLGKLGDDRIPEHMPLFGHIRIEACDTCHQYLLNVDLAASVTFATAAVANVHSRPAPAALVEVVPLVHL